MKHKDLINAYEFCLGCGWVHNTPKDTIIIDYEHRQGLFKNHVEKIKTHVEKKPEPTIHILIGEAPPYYPNDIFPLPKHRTYFYDPTNSIHTPYFKEPYNHFEAVVTDWKDKGKGKCLDDFAKCGVLIFDIFPFPIFQTTKNRQRVNRKSVINTADNLTSEKKTAFNYFLNTYFCSRLDELLSNFETKPEVKFYLFAPKYTSIQFLSWCYLAKENCAVKESLQENLVKFVDENSAFQCSMKEDGSALASPTTTGVLKLKKANILFTKDTIEFIEKIGDKQVIQNKIREHPIFMDKSGNPNFNKFINGIKNSD